MKFGKPQDTAKKSMVSGGAAMMMKSFGFEPEMVELVAADLIAGVTNVETRLAAVEATLAKLLAACEKNNAPVDGGDDEPQA